MPASIVADVYRLDPPFDLSWGDKLREARHQAGLTLVELAARSGTSYSSLRAYESLGRVHSDGTLVFQRVPSTQVQTALACVLEKPVGALFPRSLAEADASARRDLHKQLLVSAMRHAIADGALRACRAAALTLTTEGAGGADAAHGILADTLAQFGLAVDRRDPAEGALADRAEQYLIDGGTDAWAAEDDPADPVDPLPCCWCGSDDDDSGSCPGPA